MFEIEHKIFLIKSSLVSIKDIVKSEYTSLEILYVGPV